MLTSREVVHHEAYHCAVDSANPRRRHSRRLGTLVQRDILAAGAAEEDLARNGAADLENLITDLAMDGVHEILVIA
jgi:hypothetical protein